MAATKPPKAKAPSDAAREVDALRAALAEEKANHSEAVRREQAAQADAVLGRALATAIDVHRWRLVTPAGSAHGTSSWRAALMAIVRGCETDETVE